MASRTYRIMFPRVWCQPVFQANLQNPAVNEIVLVEKPLPPMQTEIAQPDLPGIISEAHPAGASHAIVLAVDTKAMQMDIIPPIHYGLEHGVQLPDAGIAAHPHPSPDQRADVAQHDPELVDARSIGRFSRVHSISLYPDSAAWLLTPHFLVLSFNSL